MTATNSIAGTIFETFSRIDCTDHVEKKGSLDYIAWTFAYKTLMEHYPNNSIEFTEEWLPNNTVMIHCELSITVGKDTATRKGWLPVINFSNKAIVNPDAYQVNTTRMRCLTKTLALFGLGLNIYAGEAFPSASDAQEGVSEPVVVTITKAEAKLLGEAVEHSGRDLGKLLKHYKVNKLDELTQPQYKQALHACEKLIAKAAAAESADARAESTGLEQLAQRQQERI